MLYDIVMDFENLIGKSSAEVVTWRPQTVVDALDAAGKPVDDPIYYNKLMAALHILQGDSAFEECEVFENVINSLIEEPVLIDVIQKPDVAELILGLRIISRLRKRDYGDDVLSYIAACAADDGVVWLPSEWAPQTVNSLISSRLSRDPAGVEALQAKVKEAFEKITNDYSPNETALGVQMAKLLRIKKYLEKVEGTV